MHQFPCTHSHNVIEITSSAIKRDNYIIAIYCTNFSCSHSHNFINEISWSAIKRNNYIITRHCTNFPCSHTHKFMNEITWSAIKRNNYIRMRRCTDFLCSHSSKLESTRIEICLPFTPKHSFILFQPRRPHVPVSNCCVLCLSACLLIVCPSGRCNEWLQVSCSLQSLMSTKTAAAAALVSRLNYDDAVGCLTRGRMLPARKLSHSEHRFPVPSLKEGCRKPVLGVWETVRLNNIVNSCPQVMSLLVESMAKNWTRMSSVKRT